MYVGGLLRISSSYIHDFMVKSKSLFVVSESKPENQFKVYILHTSLKNLRCFSMHPLNFCCVKTLVFLTPVVCFHGFSPPAELSLCAFALKYL